VAQLATTTAGEARDHASPHRRRGEPRGPGAPPDLGQQPQNAILPRGAVLSRASCGGGHAVASAGPRLQFRGRRCGIKGLPLGVFLRYRNKMRPFWRSIRAAVCFRRAAASPRQPPPDAMRPPGRRRRADLALPPGGGRKDGAALVARSQRRRHLLPKKPDKPEGRRASLRKKHPGESVAFRRIAPCPRAATESAEWL